MLGCYDPKNELFEAVCKIGTGFSDEFLKTSTERLMPKVVEKKPEEYKVSRTLKPDVWFSSKSSEVWEVECDSMT